MINQDSPIIQNMNGVPNTGTPFYPQNINIGNQYYMNPAERFNQVQQNYIQPFGTLGYNPQVPTHPSLLENGINPLLQIFDPSIPQGRMNNSAFSRSRNPYNMNNNSFQQQPVMDIEYITEAGWSPSGTKYMMSSDYEERVNNLVEKIQAAQEEYNSNYTYSLYNYYNTNRGGYNPYVIGKFSNEIKEIENESIKNRIEFNKKLSRSANLYANSELPDDEYLNSIYESRQVKNINAPVTPFDIQYNNLKNVVPVDYRNEIYKCNYVNNKITDEHNELLGCGANCSLKDFLDNAGKIRLNDAIEESENLKKDKSKTYASGNEYQQYLASQLQSRDGSIPSVLYGNLASSGSITNNGSLNIKVPDFLQNKKIESENSYAEDRAKFIQSIYNPTSLL